MYSLTYNKGLLVQHPIKLCHGVLLTEKYTQFQSAKIYTTVIDVAGLAILFVFILMAFVCV